MLFQGLAVVRLSATGKMLQSKTEGGVRHWPLTISKEQFCCWRCCCPRPHGKSWQGSACRVAGLRAPPRHWYPAPTKTTHLIATLTIGRGERADDEQNQKQRLHGVQYASGTESAGVDARIRGQTNRPISLAIQTERPRSPAASV